MKTVSKAEIYAIIKHDATLVALLKAFQPVKVYHKNNKGAWLWIK